MNRNAIIVAITLCACKRQETQRAEAITQSNPVVPDSVASPTPSDTQDLGLGLTGVGEGGGHGIIGIGSIGTGVSTGHGRLGRDPPGARLRQGTTTVNGRLPPEVIQRVVRQNFGRFRPCYEAGLQRDPQLAGTIAVKFVIDRTGSVINPARDTSTTLADAAVVTCVVDRFSALSFPQPEGGIVTVVFPIVFAPPNPTE